MSVAVRLYAGLREAAGTSELTVEGETIAAVKEAVAAACPSIAGQLGFCRFAMNDEFVDTDAPVAGGARVDIVPPVSGG